MIDLKDLRANPDKYRAGMVNKGYPAELLDQLLAANAELRPLITRREQITAEKNQIGKEIGKLAGQMKKADADQKQALQQQMQDLKGKPDSLKEEEASLTGKLAELETQRDKLWLSIPQPADTDVPVGKSAEDNVQLSTWHPNWFDPAKSFKDNKGFAPKTHIQLGQALGLFDFERGVKMAGSRSYVMTGDGMRLHQAVLRFAFDFMTNENGFTPLSVPVVVRDECMVGTGFFPDGKEQAYEIKETDRGGGYDLYLTGTGEVGLMGFHQGEILDADSLPRCYTTVSTCFRREAGAAGKDTAGLYRVHQFDKVEQVVICKADEQTSRDWHKKMLGFVETLLQKLELPYRLLQCCTGDLGTKNADMIDVEAWMPGRGPEDADSNPTGEYGETHSASRLYDYQCRRLNMRYRDPETRKPVICHSLNNTVAASPRILVAILEMYQNEDGTITVPAALRPYMNGQERLG